MKRGWTVAGLALLTLTGCGSERQAALKAVSPGAPAAPGPAATPEEMAGSVPVLRGLSDPRPLVPPELIPPEAPSDPDPGFD